MEYAFPIGLALQEGHLNDPKCHAGIVLTPQGSEDNKDLPNPPGPEPSEIQPTEKSSRTKSLKAEYDNPKDTVVRPRSAPAAGTSATLGGAFSKLRIIITKVKQ